MGKAATADVLQRRDDSNLSWFDCTDESGNLISRTNREACR